MKKYMVLLILGLFFFSAGCKKEEITAPESYPITDNITSEDMLSEENSQENVGEYEGMEELDSYIFSVAQQAEKLNTSLEEEELTQTEMNEKSQAIYQLWDEALNFLWTELKNSLSDEVFNKLKEEQLLWIEDKERKVEEAGKKFEGGSLYPLVVNGEAAVLTQERVYQLYEILKEAQK